MAASRSNFSDIGNTYLNSELTRARVPLRAVAQLAPEWQTSRIVRRNGVRTLTIRAFAKPGHYASKILEEAMPKIKALELPAGYRIDYGGEKFNQDETFPQMVGALGISLVAIFLVLLVGTALTVLAAFYDFPYQLNTIVALTIAVTKATFVVLYFMHVRYSSRLVWVIVASGLFWLAILFALTFSDYLTRGWIRPVY